MCVSQKRDLECFSRCTVGLSNLSVQDLYIYIIQLLKHSKYTKFAVSDKRPTLKRSPKNKRRNSKQCS